jgi:hypothetical protein
MLQELMNFIYVTHAGIAYHGWSYLIFQATLADKDHVALFMARHLTPRARQGQAL